MSGSFSRNVGIAAPMLNDRPRRVAGQGRRCVDEGAADPPTAALLERGCALARPPFVAVGLLTPGIPPAFVEPPGFGVRAGETGRLPWSRPDARGVVFARDPLAAGAPGADTS